MTGDRCTLDTNILLYAIDFDSGAKHHTAVDLVEHLIGSDLVLTLQALSEFVSVVTKKRWLTLREAERQMNAWRDVFPVRAPSLETLVDAIAGVETHGLSFWDAMLWACAREAGCTVILSEDFQHGRTIGGVRFHDPFAEPFALPG